MLKKQETDKKPETTVFVAVSWCDCLTSVCPSGCGSPGSWCVQLSAPHTVLSPTDLRRVWTIPNGSWLLNQILRCPPSCSGSEGRLHPRGRLTVLLPPLPLRARFPWPSWPSSQPLLQLICRGFFLHALHKNRSVVSNLLCGGFAIFLPDVKIIQL